jgi:hypothetical protein
VKVDEARRARTGHPDSVNHREALLKCLAGRDGELRLVGAPNLPHRGLKLRRAHVGGGRVDKIADQIARPCSAEHARAIHTGRADELRQGLLRLAIGSEAVSLKAPAERDQARICHGHLEAVTSLGKRAAQLRQGKTVVRTAHEHLRDGT